MGALLCSIVAILAFALLILAHEMTLFVLARVRRVGGLIFFRFGRFGGSFYISAR